MNDQHITAIATIVQDILLLLSAVLIALYLWETRKMRKAAEDQVSKSQELVSAAQRQIESAWRPAIVAKARGSTEAAPVLENIGNGPALDVKWSVSNSKAGGAISYMEPHASIVLAMDGMKPIYEAGAKDSSVSIVCLYRSLSGWSYSSTSAYDLYRDQFSATFSTGQPHQEQGIKERRDSSSSPCITPA